MEEEAKTREFRGPRSYTCFLPSSKVTLPPPLSEATEGNSSFRLESPKPKTMIHEIFMIRCSLWGFTSDLGERGHNGDCAEAPLRVTTTALGPKTRDGVGWAKDTGVLRLEESSAAGRAR